jgi:acyl-CoA synthetase (AMP-forming)/AMP-acid ligase II
MFDDYRPSTFATWTQQVVRHLERPSHEVAVLEATPDGTTTWTRGDLRAVVTGVVDLLTENEVPDGAVVPALLSNRPASVAALIAGAISNRPLAPFAPRMTEAELLHVLLRIPGDILLVEAESVALGERLGDQLGKRAVLVDPTRTGSGELRAQDDPERTAFVMHTSGTTGAPKRVEVPDGRLARRADVNGYLLQLTPHDRLVTTSLFHHVGGMGNFAVALGSGAAIVMFPQFSVDAWRQLDAAEPTVCVTIPTVFEMLLTADALSSQTMRVLAYGASPIHPDTMRRIQEVMPHIDFVNLFGQTEGSPVSVLTPADHRRALAGQANLLRSVGQAAPQAELRIHEPDTKGVGEVWMRAPHSFVVDGQGWQHTGDLGRLEDGYLYLVGRRGDKIIRGGENVYPLEVEQVLEQHPGIRAASVVGVPDRRLGETVMAYLISEADSPDEQPDVEELRRFARERLVGFKVPVAWEFVGEFPRNVNGKVLRHVLAARAAELAAQRGAAGTGQSD